MKTVLTERLGLAHPIIQAPLAGGGDTPALVAAVSKAGALGFIGASYLTPTQVAESADAVRARTDQPFGINLFAPMPAPEWRDPRPTLKRLAPYYAALGLPPPPQPAPPQEAFPGLFAAALESGAAVFSFTFGLLPPDAMAALRGKGMFVIGTATTVAEAVALERSGVDAVTLQGAEAGGHRGTFAGTFETGMVGTVSLVPQAADAVKIPVIASGGIMDGRGIAAAIALGASAVQMGTAFLTTEEAGIPEAYKAAILAAGDTDTRITSAFSGRPARGIENRFMTEMVEQDILPFPVQNTLTRPLRAAAGQQGRAEFLSLWAGQGAGLARRGRAAELVARLADEAAAAARRLGDA